MTSAYHNYQNDHYSSCFVVIISNLCRHLFREVADDLLAEIINRVDTKKERQTRLLSAKLTTDSSFSAPQRETIPQDHTASPPHSTVNDAAESSERMEPDS